MLQLNHTTMNRRDALRALSATSVTSILATPTVSLANAAQTVMKKRIPRTNESLPVIGLGTWQTFDVGNDDAARAPLREVLSAFRSAGGAMIDSSPMYGTSETVAGDLIAAQSARAQLFIATKVWTQGRASGIAQMEASMQKLRAPMIDLMQVHNLQDHDVHWPTLRAWKAERRVRYIGITHYTESAYRDVARVIERDKDETIDFLQINYSAAERSAESRLLPLARERGIGVVINRPFAGGELIRRLRDKPLPAVAKDIGATSWPQLLLKFVISHEAVTCAIPATSKLAHLLDNMRAGQFQTGLPNAAQRSAIIAAVG